MTTRPGESPSPVENDVPLHLQRRLRVEEYERMIDTGILGEDDRVELLEGVLVEMSPQGQLHARIIKRLNEVLLRSTGSEFAIWPQLPLALGDFSEPEPDMAVVPADQAESKTKHPSSAVLVIEVSGETLRKDRGIKAAIYAGAGIAHYWIVNVDAQVVEVYGNPDPPARRYRTLATLARGATLRAESLPVLSIPVTSLFD